VNIAKQKEKAKPAANLAFMMVPPLELFPGHLPCQTEVQIVTEQRECPAMRFLDDGLPLTLAKKEREDSLDLPFRSRNQTCPFKAKCDSLLGSGRVAG
jgi:hypothetical protein